MGYEIDFLSSPSGGTAVAARWGRPGKYRVLLYGVAADCAEQVIANIRAHYGTRRVDYLVSPHLDREHTEGLAAVLEKLEVGELWMHRPWHRSLRGADGLAAAKRLEGTALRLGVPVHEPFAGAVIGPFTVLSPDRWWFIHSLLPAFGEAQAAGRMTAHIARLARSAVARLCARWNVEALPRRPSTRAEDESSAVIYAEFEGRGVLLTGNAGINALDGACACAERLGLRLPNNLKLMQVPDRGKADNLSSAVLDRLVGRRVLGQGPLISKSAFVSVHRDASPSGYRVVADALRRRGVMTFATRGAQLHHAHDMPDRRWLPARAAVTDV